MRRGPVVSERWLRLRRLKVILLIGIAVVTAGVMLRLHAADTLRGAELASVDLRFSIQGEQPVPNDLVVVAIDTDTFSRLEAQWPFPRTFHARVLRNLKDAGARVIAYDVQFTEPSRQPREDLALYEAARAAAPVVFATTETDARGGHNILGGDENLRMIDARAGQALLPNDPGAVIRRLSYELGGLKSFAVVTTEMRLGRPLPRPPGETRLWIDYVGPPGTLPTIPFWRVYRGDFPTELVLGRTVVVGPSALALQDVHATAVGGEDLMSGAEIQANAIHTAARGFPLRDGANVWNVVAILLLSSIAPLATVRLPVLRALLIALAAAMAYVVAAQVAFNSGRVLAVVAPVGGFVFAAVATLGVNYFTETRERRRLRTLFSRFVPEAVVAEVVERAAAADLRLGGQRLEATVLFCDLRGFTSFAETLDAEHVIEVLNHYLEEMSEAILEHGGTLVSYMGDGIMAVFGALIEQDDHADAAFAAAREMVHVRLPRFNAWLEEEGLPAGFRMGIGINTGPVMSGNVGSKRRVEYTTVGDTTNTAARLEGMTKGTEFQVFISDATRNAMNGRVSGLVAVGETTIRGREAPMRIWALSDS